MLGLGAGRVGPDPPQQVRAGPDRLAPQGVGEEPAVGEQQHPRLQPVQQRSAKVASDSAYVPICGGEDRVGAALGQRHHPGLRERRLLALVHPRPAEVLGVRGRVGHIQAGAVDRDQPPPGQPHPRRRLGPDRPGDPREQRRQRLRTQPRPGLEDRRLARRRGTPPATPTPTTARRSAAPARPHTSPPSTAPSRSRSTPSPAPATTDAAARCGPTSAITSSTSSGGNTRVSTPTDTRSDNRRSDSGFLHPARGMPTKLHRCHLN